MPYAGMLALDGDEKPIPARVEFTSAELIVGVAAGTLGSWPLSTCRIEPDGDRFLMNVDGDLVWFDPDQPADFAREALFYGRSNGLASAVKTARMAAHATPTPPLDVATVEHEGENESPSVLAWWKALSDGRKNLVLMGAGLLGVVVVITLFSGGKATPAPAANFLTSTTAPPPAVFELNLEQLSMRWNDTADDLRLDLFIAGVPTGRRMQVDLGAGIILYATSDPTSQRVRTLMIGAGPGQDEQAEAVLAAWGTMIALVNPELDPEERRDLLDRLGVDVERPLQLGLDMETEQGGNRYWLRSGVLGTRVLLGVELAR
jgi:hypothetical protein